jgi:SRSO17 transposase
LRFFWEEQGKSYVMAVSGQESVWIGFAQYRVKTLLKQVPEDAWHRLSCGEGAKGPRLYDWAYVRVNSVTPEGWERGMLARRSLSEPSEKTAYITYAPSETTLQTLVLGAGTRWTIECCLQEAKGEVGLDQYEVRSWHGWYRHITLSMAAHAYLVVTRLQGEDGPLKGGRANPGNSLRHFKSQRGLVCR